MSFATKLHENQVSAAAKGQDVVIDAVEKAVAFQAQLQDKVLNAKAPEQLERFVKPLTEQVEKAVSARDEANQKVLAGVREWVELSQSFQNRLLDAFAPAPHVEDVATSAAKSAA